MDYLQGTNDIKQVYKENIMYKFIVSRDVTFAENEFPDFLDSKEPQPSKHRQFIMSDFNIQTELTSNNNDQDTYPNTGYLSKYRD